MESVTFGEFKNQCGRAFIVLTIIIVFCTIQIFKVRSIEYIAILITSIFGLLSVRQVDIIARKKIMYGDRKVKILESILIEIFLVFGLGFMSIYIFAVKGVYGVYLLFKDFNIFMLLFRIIVIILSYQLVSSVSKIQTVFLSKEFNE